MTNDTASPHARRLQRVIDARHTSDGAGVTLWRSLGQAPSARLDPFLMLDEFGSDRPGDYIKGFPPHPHRGFQTVTYMLDGHMLHEDHLGNRGHLRAGDVQWMTAGRGIIHSEMPQQESGLMRGFQLWVNLPARLKMSAPAYQEFEADALPLETREDGVTVRAICGATSRGTRAPVTAAHVDARYFDLTLPPGGRVLEPLPPGHRALLIVFEGAVSIAGTSVEAISVADLGDGDALECTAGGDGARALLIAGEPIGEPIAWAGPFVMNTEQELRQAFADFQAGRF